MQVDGNYILESCQMLLFNILQKMKKGPYYNEQCSEDSPF